MAGAWLAHKDNVPYLQDEGHTNGSDLEMYVHGSMRPGQTSVVDAHLLKCPTCREHLSTHVGMQVADCAIGKAKLDQTNRRSEPRFHTGNDAILQELNPLSLDRQMVKIVDISKHGIGILAPHPVFPGTLVQIRVMKAFEIGEVRHCTALGDKGYRIGLRLHVGF